MPGASSAEVLLPPFLVAFVLVIVCTYISSINLDTNFFFINRRLDYGYVFIKVIEVERRVVSLSSFLVPGSVG